MKRAQIAIEFILFTIIAIFIVLGMAGIGLNLADNEFDDQRQDELLDLAQTIQEEFLLATEVEFGYHRIVHTPIKLERGEYFLTNDGSSVTIWTDGVNFTMDLPPHQGTLVKGKNELVNLNGTIIIKQ